MERSAEVFEQDNIALPNTDGKLKCVEENLLEHIYILEENRQITTQFSGEQTRTREDRRASYGKAP